MMAPRVGIIGLGLMGDVMAVGLAEAGFEVVAVCDTDATRLASVADNRGVAHRYADAHELLAGESLDVLAIATPPDAHCRLSVAALERGLHVLCEKPTAMDAGEARRMVEAAEASGRIALIDHELRFNPGRARLRELVTGGAIGRVRHALHVAVVPGMWEMREWTWWSTREHGGGLLGEVGSHAVDLLRWMLGDVVAVGGRVATFIERRADRAGVERVVDSDDYAAFRLDFTSGAVADVVLSAVSGGPTNRRLEVHGDAGSVVFDGDERLWLWRSGGTEPEELTVPETMPSLIGWPGDFYSPAFLRLARRFRSAIEDGGRPDPAPDFRDGLAIQLVLDAVRAGGTQQLPER